MMMMMMLTLLTLMFIMLSRFFELLLLPFIDQSLCD